MAENYLLVSELSISDIARLLGYAEHSGFTRSFSQWYGLPPNEYRDHKLTCGDGVRKHI